MSTLLHTRRLRFGTPREMNPIGPQMLTALVTRHIIARRRNYFVTLIQNAGNDKPVVSGHEHFAIAH